MILSIAEPLEQEPTMHRQSARLLTQTAFAAVAATLLTATPALAQDSGNASAEEGADAPAIVVIGSRRQDRTVADSAVPIDVISAESLTENGYTETNRLLGQLVPSFNFPQPSLTDGTDSVRPATLRGLAPDQTLVLVNGRRRHNSALLNLNGSVGRGSSAVDLNTIPPLAIEQIEVLRDGASSQYGSDAIAGVINVRLRRAEGGRATITFGQYRTTLAGVPDVNGVQLGTNGQPALNPNAGASGVYLLTDTGRERRRNDGETLTIATNIGLPVGDSAYVNLTAQFQDRNPTNRSAADPRTQYPLIGGNVDPRELTFNRFNHRFGDAETQDMTFFINAGADISANVELYGWASYNIRDGESAGFYRRANDARNRDFGASTTTFVPFYPDGFLPFIASTVEDLSVAAGLRGEVSGWNYDLSAVYGSNSFQFGVTNSFNTSIGSPNSARRFDAGALRFGQTSINLDLQREFEGIGDGLSVAIGAEYRNENFRIVAGELQSYQGGPFALSPFNAPAGSQVFPGFRPANEVDASRDSYAAYIELESELFTGFTLQAAGRYEHFSDFGDTLNGKLAARFEPIEGIGLRGSISTGFRAPSLHQQFYATTSTNNVNGTLVEIGTFPVESPVAAALGSQPLEPEESLNYSAGVTFDLIPRLSITADYYHIDINNRIVITENLTGAAVVALLQGAGFNNITSARFFINGIDTTTEGFDIVASYRVPDMGFGNIRLTAGYNNNQTTITDRAILPTLPGLTLFGRQNSIQLTNGQPRDKINFGIDWDLGILSTTFRGNRYGEVTSPGVDAARDQVFGSEWVFDLELRARPSDAIEIAVGANNLFDQYPDRPRAGVVNGQNYGLNSFFLAYSSFSPFGFNGRFVYGRVSLNF
jgi:iron complex outermembrane receptor protein